MRAICVLLLLACLFALEGCGFNRLFWADEAVKTAWLELSSRYQQRTELASVLAQERDEAMCDRIPLLQVASARARLGAIQVTPAIIDDVGALRRFQRAQADLAGALSRYLGATRTCPGVQAGASTRVIDLQLRLNDDESRVAVARARYNAAIAEYNAALKVFPYNWTSQLFRMRPRPSLDVADELASAARRCWNALNGGAMSVPVAVAPCSSEQ